MSPSPIPLRALRDPVLLLATGFGAGLLRPAPGTWGTLVGLPAAVGLMFAPLPVALAVLTVATAVGVPLCSAAGRRLGVADHGGVVWDEIVGIGVALVFLAPSPLAVVTGFLAFRAFDILKPWPVSWADGRLEGGLGVMVDDLFAGLYAAGTTAGLLALLPAAP